MDKQIPSTDANRTVRRNSFLRTRFGFLVGLVALVMVVGLVTVTTISFAQSKKRKASAQTRTATGGSGRRMADPTGRGQGQNAGTPIQQQRQPFPEVQTIEAVSQNKDLRDLPYIAPTRESDEQPLRRHPLAGNPMLDPTDPEPAQRTSFPAIALPTPFSQIAGITSAQSGCGCLPPDTDGDVGPSNYIQSVNSSIKIWDKSGNALNGTNGTTYNTFFSPMGTSTPCGNSQNGGDGIVFYDHVADRWVVSDFAFPGFPGAVLLPVYRRIQDGRSGLRRLVAVWCTGRPGESFLDWRLSKVWFVAGRLLSLSQSVCQQYHL